MIDQEEENLWKALMPPSVYECFEPLSAELSWISAVWGELVIISGSDENLALVNAAAGGFFHVVGKSLWDYVILGICRMADPPGTANRPNLTIRRMLEAIDNRDLRLKLDRIFLDCSADISAMSGHRNQRIAHNDFSTILGTPLRLLESVKRERVENTLERFAAILGEVEQFYVQGATLPMAIPAGAGRLLVLLKDARDAGLIEDDR